MALVSQIRDNDWRSVRQAVSKLASLKLGPNSAPTFSGLTLSGNLAVKGITTLGSSGQLTVDASGNLITTGTIIADGQGSILGGPEHNDNAESGYTRFGNYAVLITRYSDTVGVSSGPRLAFRGADVTDEFAGDYNPDNKIIGRLEWRPWNDGGFEHAAGIYGVASEDHSLDNIGTELEFYYTPNGTVGARLGWTIKNDGSLVSAVGAGMTVDSPTFYVDGALHRIGIGTLAPAAYLLDCQGTANFSDDVTMANGLTVNTTDFVVDDINHKVEIGSADGSNKIQIFHDNFHTFFKTTDGSFYFQTDEGTNTHTYVCIQGKGTGIGFLNVYDQDNAEYVHFRASSGRGYLSTLGTNPISLRLQSEADIPIEMFAASDAGETQELQIYGYRTDDAKRHLDISVGQYADDTAEFYGVSNYLFDGNLDASLLKVAGTQVIGAQQAHIADAATQDVAGADTVDEVKVEADLTSCKNAINSILSVLETHGLLAAA